MNGIDRCAGTDVCCSIARRDAQAAHAGKGRRLRIRIDSFAGRVAGVAPRITRDEDRVKITAARNSRQDTARFELFTQQLARSTIQFSLAHYSTSRERSYIAREGLILSSAFANANKNSS